MARIIAAWARARLPAVAHRATRRRTAEEHDGLVSAALPAMTPASGVTEWTPQPVAIALAVLATAWYWRGVVRIGHRGEAWPARRSAMFAFAVVAFVWTTCGYPQVYAHAMFSAWVAQTLGLWIALPVVLMAGQPAELAHRLAGERAIAIRFLRSRLGRTLENPLVGPAVIPVLSVVLFFGPVPGWAIGVAPFGWVLQPVLVVIGSMIALPLVQSTDERGSQAVALAAAVGLFELLLDAVPGIVLRFQTHLSSTFFDYRAVYGWSPHPLHDQQWGGTVLWCVAEAIDLPFLLLIARRWIHADARDAAEIDAVLDAERIARAAIDPEPGAAPVDQPWWLSDPAMQERLRRQRGP